MWVGVRISAKITNESLASYEFYAYNLLQGAKVFIDFELSGNAEFFVIEGDSNMKDWEKGDTVSYIKNLFTNSLQGYSFQVI